MNRSVRCLSIPDGVTPYAWFLFIGLGVSGLASVLWAAGASPSSDKRRSSQLDRLPRPTLNSSVRKMKSVNLIVTKFMAS